MAFNSGYLRSKIARRIFVLFFAATLFPLLLTVVLSYQEISRLIEGERASQLKRDNKQLSQVTYERLTNIQSKLQSLLLDIRTERGLPHETTSLLHSYISSAVILDIHSGEPTELMGKSSQLVFSSFDMRRISSTSSTLFTMGDANNIQADIYLARKLHSNELDGHYLIVKVRPDYLWPDDQLPFETQVVVFDQQGRMLQRNDDLRIDQKQFAPLLNPEYKFQSRIEIDNESYLVNIRNLFMDAQFNSSDWVFVGIQPFSFTTADLNRFRNYFIPPILLSLTLITFICLILIKRNLVPVEKLLKGTKQIALNDFGYQIEVQSKDEFGILAESFNAMTTKLKNLFGSNKALSEIDRLILENTNIDDVAATVVTGIQYVFPAQTICLILNELDDQKSSVAYVLSDFSSIYCKHSLNTRIDEKDLSLFSPENKGLTGDSWAKTLQSILPTSNNFIHAIPIAEENHAYGLLLVANQASMTLDRETLLRANEYGNRVTVALAALVRNKRLAYQANIDSLTGIPNRRQMKRSVSQVIDHAIANGTQGAVLFIDLDRFKHVNDAYGHPVGDQLLIQAAQRLTDCLGPGQIVSRFGGDEFAILLSTIESIEVVEQLAEAAIETLSTPFKVDSRVSYVGASLGVALFPDHADNFDELLKMADTAMYQAKHAGRGQYVIYHKELGESSLNRSVIEHELREAIKNDTLEVYFQPKVGAEVGIVKGFEALLRWQHKKVGFISPAEIIPIAEESSLINDLGDWVMRRVCQQIKSWQKISADNSELIYAVNVSSKQLMDEGYIDRLKDIIDQTGVDTSSLEIEITENLFLNDQQRIIQVLDQIHELGIKIAIDDFGTGFSSLSYLSNLPIDTLKIDRSFIDPLERSEKSSNLVKTIIAMAYNLNLNVVAEGVESAYQLSFLKKVSGNEIEIQGYFFSKPLPVIDAGKVVANVNYFVGVLETAIVHEIAVSEAK